MDTEKIMAQEIRPNITSAIAFLYFVSLLLCSLFSLCSSIYSKKVKSTILRHRYIHLHVYALRKESNERRRNGTTDTASGNVTERTAIVTMIVTLSQWTILIVGKSMYAILIVGKSMYAFQFLLQLYTYISKPLKNVIFCTLT